MQQRILVYESSIEWREYVSLDMYICPFIWCFLSNFQTCNLALKEEVDNLK